ncbi:integral membrane PTH11 [Fusarium albosuccineum]|uniref:Integral membrane PTH11 n=1 Tax=Fusarium albosuccineum TaxID=1237068 RepID=A0A8H4LFK1_9HYPO|nr:integral membrane PTH11 [Fusarium albosuccineum]
MADSAIRSFTIEALSLLAVSICVILFRTYVRIAQVGIRRLAPDDYLMLLVIIPYSIETSMAYFVGNVFHGLSNSNMTPAQRAALDSESTEFKWRVGGSKSQVTGWVMYSTVLWVIKSALCAFYLRLTGGLPPYKSRIYAGFGIIVVTYITVICSLLFSCQPFHKFWQINPDPGNHCQSAASRVYIFVVVTLNISTDVYLLFIPIPMLWSAQIRKAKKVGLIVLFSGGIFVMVAGILRAVLIIKNPTTGALQSASWAVRESFVAIVTSNLPMTYGWFQQKLKPVLGSWLSSSDTNHKSGPEPGSMVLDNVGHHSGWRSEHGESMTGERSIDESGDGVYMHSDLASSDEIMCSSLTTHNRCLSEAMETAASRLRQQSWRRDSYLISTDSSLLPISKLIEVFSSDEFYWAKAMPEAAMKEMLDNSLCFGLYHSPDKTNPEDGAGIFVGIARGVTDFTTFFYLTDVWVDPTYQGKGLGSWLVRCVQEVIESMPYLRRSILMTASWEKTVPFYEKLMDMKVFECRQGEGLAIMEKKGAGHPAFGREGT